MNIRKKIYDRLLEDNHDFSAPEFQNKPSLYGLYGFPEKNLEFELRVFHQRSLAEVAVMHCPDGRVIESDQHHVDLNMVFYRNSVQCDPALSIHKKSRN